MLFVSYAILEGPGFEGPINDNEVGIWGSILVPQPILNFALELNGQDSQNLTEVRFSRVGG